MKNSQSVVTFPFFSMCESSKVKRVFPYKLNTLFPFYIFSFFLCFFSLKRAAKIRINKNLLPKEKERKQEESFALFLLLSSLSSLCSLLSVAVLWLQCQHFVPMHPDVVTAR